MPQCRVEYQIKSGKNSISDSRNMEYRECDPAVLPKQLAFSLAQSYGVTPEDVEIISHTGPKADAATFSQSNDGPVSQSGQFGAPITGGQTEAPGRPLENASEKAPEKAPESQPNPPAAESPPAATQPAAESTKESKESKGKATK